MKITGRRIFTAFTLALGAVTLYQALSKPAPIAQPQTAETAKANAESFDRKLAQLQTSKAEGGGPTEAHFSSQEVSAEISQSMSPAPATATVSSPSPENTVGSGEVQVKNYQVELQGNEAMGQFVTQVAGKDLYVTLAGRLGSRDGYITFDPTEFKVGDMSIPISLVNSALQKKLAEQREQLKLPDGVASLRVENGELVITEQ